MTIQRTEYIEDRTALDDAYDAMMEEWNANVKGDHIYDGFNFDNTNVATQVAAVEANIDTYYNPLVNGLVEDVDATIEQFRQALEAAGMTSVQIELGIGREIYREKDEFYNPTPIFTLAAFA